MIGIKMTANFVLRYDETVSWDVNIIRIRDMGYLVGKAVAESGGLPVANPLDGYDGRPCAEDFTHAFNQNSDRFGGYAVMDAYVNGYHKGYEKTALDISREEDSITIY